MDVGGTVQANPGVPVFVVVPLHKIGQEASRIGQGGRGCQMVCVSGPS